MDACPSESKYSAADPAKDGLRWDIIGGLCNLELTVLKKTVVQCKLPSLVDSCTTTQLCSGSIPRPNLLQNQSTDPCQWREGSVSITSDFIRSSSNFCSTRYSTVSRTISGSISSPVDTGLQQNGFGYSTWSWQYHVTVHTGPVAKTLKFWTIVYHIDNIWTEEVRLLCQN